MTRVRLGITVAMVFAGRGGGRAGSAAAPAARAANAPATINGAGSAEASIAINQWQADVARQGLPVNYIANGDAAGHFFYIQKQSDFAVSSLPFTGDELEQAADRPYEYVPLLAESVGFMYNLTVAGRALPT